MIPYLHSPSSSFRVTITTPERQPQLERTNISTSSDFLTKKTLEFLIPDANRTMQLSNRGEYNRFGAADVGEEIETPIRKPKHLEAKVRRRSFLNPAVMAKN